MACRPAGAGPPHPHPLPRGARGRLPLPVIPAKAGIQPGHRRGPTLSPGEGAGTPSRLCPARRSRRGRGGRSPHMKKIRGRVGGPEPRAAQAPPGWGCGGRSSPQGTRACPRRLVVRRAPDPLTPALCVPSVGGFPPHPPRRCTCALEVLLPGGRRTPSPPPSVCLLLGGSPHTPLDAARAPSKCCCLVGVGPPHPRPLPQGARGPERPRGCAPPADPDGGVGASPPQNKIPRVGGRARAARSAGSSGMGVWGATPPTRDTRCAL